MGHVLAVPESAKGVKNNCMAHMIWSCSIIKPQKNLNTIKYVCLEKLDLMEEKMTTKQILRSSLRLWHLKIDDFRIFESTNLLLANMT